MTYLGDYAAGCTVFDMFTFTDVSGRPSPWTGTPSPCLVVYRTDPGGSSCTTAGITVSRNCNGLTGVNAWSVDTEIDKAFYACGRNYQVITSNGCVDSICVSNYVVGRFSLSATSLHAPVLAQPSAIFAWPASFRSIMAWLGAVASNKIVQEAGQQGVCNRAGTTLIARAQTTDDGTSATRAEFL